MNANWIWTFWFHWGWGRRRSIAIHHHMACRPVWSIQDSYIALRMRRQSPSVLFIRSKFRPNLAQIPLSSSPTLHHANTTATRQRSTPAEAASYQQGTIQVVARDPFGNRYRSRQPSHSDIRICESTINDTIWRWGPKQLVDSERARAGVVSNHTF